MGERRGVCRVLMGKPEGKRPLRRLRRRWDVGAWIGSMWFRIGTIGGHL